jgi:hypothetical protein
MKHLADTVNSLGNEWAYRGILVCLIRVMILDARKGDLMQASGISP